MHPHHPEKTTLVHPHDIARQEAHRLRHEAVDDFWRGADAIWQRSLAGAHLQVQRSADRLKARLDRRTHRPTPATTRKA